MDAIKIKNETGLELTVTTEEKENELNEEFPKYSEGWFIEKTLFIEKIKSLPENDQFVIQY